MKGYKIEICANSSESAIIAQRSGADRVELCAGMPEGGTTPSFGEIAAARTKLKRTKLHVIIRPRGGDFCYSPAEIRIMTNDIKMASSLNVDGFVFGCLTPDGDVDSAAMKKLIKAAKGKSVTFHRAFDMCRDPFKALEDIISLGCDRILTSGQQNVAERGVSLIKKLIELAAGRIIIMPGSGIVPQNIRKIAEETGATEFHFSGRKSVESPMMYRNPMVSMGGTLRIDEYSRFVTDPEVVKTALDVLKRL
ncbi:MAG: copper homeostasis protein CutC [Bacteroidaceae bacterium]|nr:copper homeostasis protein CutC [Bacteroidaceae bacterium]MBP3833325.1 copper homeostasis protein CutC [Bacteroidaceae bacterium]